ncbi:hypothetical protein CO174_01085 [Candidatus Uhrbacteria bacterium CG_4_9_14_3_um_filter_50_9]|uniref:Uncharacterized protein n=1 Tax=Candidatus Uhrbacteria bacterium CG_4_9_14_3_um_filter_50_9 TaxID=1975035 RepID=A0A2M7XEA5_9BACT|nr:MAG: hypothetical protein CO174_01085 [Candidatus Uhrbacteria bacterium CG_4_9_14_3_um_filter_50_9]
MTLVGILTFIGWVFTLTPLLIVIGVSAVMIKGAAGDDDLIMALTMLGITIFVIGVILLILVYLSGMFEQGGALTLLQ